MLFLWSMNYRNCSFLKRMTMLVIVCLGIPYLLNSCLNENIGFPFPPDRSSAGVKKTPIWLKLNVDEALPRGEIVIWVPTNNFETSSLIKVPRYPRKFRENELADNPMLKNFIINSIENQDTLRLYGVRNEQISAQLGLASRNSLSDIKVWVNELVSDSGVALSKSQSRVRLVKYLPVTRSRSEYVWSPMMEEIIGEETSGDMNPNMVADVLVDFDVTSLESYTAQPFWFTFNIPPQTNPGVYRGYISFSGKESGNVRRWQIPLQIEVNEVILPDPESYKFHLDLWFNPSSIADYYKVEHWSEHHWQLVKVYLEDYLSRGGKNITAIITHQPWHKPWLEGGTHSQIEYGYESMIDWIKTGNGNWRFDYTIFDRYIELSREIGIKGSINAFSMTPFHTDQRIRYWNEGLEKYEVLNLNVSERDYELIWEKFLFDFKNHLINRGWYENTYLAFDEKPKEILSRIMTIVEKSAPELINRLAIAGHPEATKYAQNLSISYMFFPGQTLEKKAIVPVLPEIKSRKRQKKITTFYLSAEPSHPNTLTYSPAIEAWMIPWIALKYDLDGYLRWAYNNWTSDPFNKPVFLHSQGDDYYVYPGKEGPISSIRWELLKEGIEDYELIQIIKQTGNLSEESIHKAVELATRNEDGRYKNTEDIIKSRKILVERKEVSNMFLFDNQATRK